MTKKQALRDLRQIRDSFRKIHKDQIDQTNGRLADPYDSETIKEYDKNKQNKIKKIKNSECGVCVGSWICHFFDLNSNWKYTEGADFYYSRMKVLGFNFDEARILLKDTAEVKIYKKRINKLDVSAFDDPFLWHPWRHHAYDVFSCLIIDLKNTV